MKGYASSNPQVKMAEPSRTPKYQKSRRHDKRRRFSFLVSLTPDTWHLWCHNLILLWHHACHERQKWCDIQPAHVLQVSNQAHLACCKWAIKLTLLQHEQFDQGQGSEAELIELINLWPPSAALVSFSSHPPSLRKELAFSMGLFWVILWKIDGA